MKKAQPRVNSAKPSKSLNSNIHNIATPTKNAMHSLHPINPESTEKLTLAGNFDNTGNKESTSSIDAGHIKSTLHPHIVSAVGYAGNNTKSEQPLEPYQSKEFSVIQNRKGFKDGVYWHESANDEDASNHPLWLCSPLIVIAETRDKDQSNWGRWLSWQDSDGHQHEWACPREILASSDLAEFRRELARNGLTISPNTKARQKLAEYVSTCQPQSAERVRCVTKIGWHGNRYVLSNRVFGKKDGEGVIFQGTIDVDFASAGELADWQREVAKRAEGNSRMVFAISTSFAGALIEMANESGGGFQFTGMTSNGKTSTLIDPAASVFGHPDSFAKKWRTTANGLEALCLARNHSTLILDDLGQADAKECGQAAYLIANGQGKARMQKEGGNRPLSTWKTMILSSGEIDLSQHMAEAGKVAKGGQVVRLPSIPADAGAGLFVLETLHDQADGRQFSDTMKAVTRKYYGTAGIAYLEKLVEPHTFRIAKENISHTITEIVKLMPIPTGSAPEVGRVATRFALVAYAGELASYFGITGWTVSESINAACRCYDDWLADSGGALGTDNRVLFMQVSAYMQVHGTSRFPHHSIRREDLALIDNRAGFSYEKDGRIEYWVNSETFKNEICKGFNVASAAKTLADAQWLELGAGRNQQKKRITALGSTGIWFYVLTDKSLGGEL